MEMHQIRYFLAVAEERHISRAAQKCNVSQPSLSRAIKKLEDELGGALFERNPGKVELTAFGREVLPLLRNCYNAAQSVKSRAKSKRNGDALSLRIAFQSGVFHPAFIDVFRAMETRFPRATIAVSQLPSEALTERLRAGEFDAAIAVNGQMDDEIRHAALYEERLEVAFQPGHRFEGLAEIGLAEMCSEKLIAGVFYDELARRANLYNGAEKAIRIDSLCLAQAMTAAGFACSLSPEFAPRHPELVRRSLASDHAVRQVSVLTPAARPASAITSEFLRLCAQTAWKQGQASRGPTNGADHSQWL